MEEQQQQSGSGLSEQGLLYPMRVETVQQANRKEISIVLLSEGLT
jgi:hypothetical protein